LGFIQEIYVFLLTSLQHTNRVRTSFGVSAWSEQNLHIQRLSYGSTRTGHGWWPHGSPFIRCSKI